MSDNKISFMDPEVQTCPFSAYEAVRKEGPLYVDPKTGWYIVTDFELVRSLSMDTDNLSSFTGALFCKQNQKQQREIDQIYSKEGFNRVPVLVVSDPPEHKFYRSFLEKALTVSRVKQLEGYLDKTVDEMIDGIIDRGRIEFKYDFAVKVPLTVAADLIGLPRSDYGKLNYWGEAIVENLDQSVGEERQIELAHIICEFHRYAADKITEYRQHPRECLLSDLATTSIDGRQLTMEELIAIMEQLVSGGQETTANALANGMLRLAQQPELQNQLRIRPELIAKFVEECLRIDAPVQGLFRVAKQDMDVAGHHIQKNSIVVLRWGAANRDPGVFGHPDEINIERSNLNRHLTFGAGPHYCVGNQLARAEMRISFQKLLAKMKNIRLEHGRESVEREPHFFIYGPVKLHIAFDKN